MEVDCVTLCTCTERQLDIRKGKTNRGMCKDYRGLGDRKGTGKTWVEEGEMGDYGD